MHLPHIGVDDLECEVLLVTEVVVEGSLWNARRRQQGLQAEAVVSSFQEQGQAGGDQALACGRFGTHHTSFGREGRRGRHRPSSSPPGPQLAVQLPGHVLDDVAVLPLRAEHDDLCVGVDLHVVPGRPVEKIVLGDRLLLAVRVGGGEVAAQHESPVGALAAVTVQPLE